MECQHFLQDSQTFFRLLRNSFLIRETNGSSSQREVGHSSVDPETACIQLGIRMHPCPKGTSTRKCKDESGNKFLLQLNKKKSSSSGTDNSNSKDAT